MRVILLPSKKKQNKKKNLRFYITGVFSAIRCTHLSSKWRQATAIEEASVMVSENCHFLFNSKQVESGLRGTTHRKTTTRKISNL